jgi:hypothetical protein
VARTAAQIRTGHWRSAAYLKRIRKPGYPDDKCWFCDRPAKMTRSHVLLHCKNPKLTAARAEAWEGKRPGGVRVLLANPRWERRFVRFLELSGVGRVMKDGTDEESAYAARMDEWVAWETRRERGGLNCLARFSLLLLLLYGGTPAPETCAQRTGGGLEAARLSFVSRCFGTYLFRMTPFVCEIKINK